MKCLITYFQNKRVALPTIFAKYTLPMMRATFPGEVKFYNIHHNLHVTHSRLSSTRDLGEDALIRARQQLRSNVFENVISHQELFHDFYLMPSCRIGLKLCQDEDADFHLWLEDDAIVHDPMCYLWPVLMKYSEVGTFRQTAQVKMFNCAFLLTTKQYDARLLDALPGYRDDGLKYPDSSQFEHLLWKVSKSSCVLHPFAAMRHHPRGKYKNTRDDVLAWLKETIPNISQGDLDLLRTDFADTYVGAG